ncbi:hypothetical protein PR048_010183 [Dryococelus australis]|uniref:Early growth response 1 n=1 Tax=Dryococelus australis TaxID=614101 RepID=A0ABQ9I223_9NEOP|nr:hypothetical protein PR048_010183 [Dryococelus australis]
MHGAEWCTICCFQVEFVEGSPSEFVQTFPNFETDASFSPQPSSSSEFEQHVSPLDPSMNCTTHYSPVYTVTQSPQATDSNSSSNPPSPFQVGKPAPHSPYIDTAQSIEPGTSTPYVGNLPDNPQGLSALTKSTLSTSSDSKKLLEQVTMDRYFQETHDSPPSTSDTLSQLSVSEKFAISTSASEAAVGFESAVSLASNRSSESVESSQELLIHASLNNTQVFRLVF